MAITFRHIGLILLFIILQVFVTCTTKEYIGLIDLPQRGAYVRLTQHPDIDSIAIKALTDFRYSFWAEFVDQEQGKLVSEYILEVQYIDGSSENGANTFPPKLLRSFTQADFKTNWDGYREIQGVFLRGDELIEVLEIPIDSFDEGDKIVLRGKLVMQDGSVFTSDNTSASLEVGALQAQFDIPFTLYCGSELEGTYQAIGYDFFCGTGDTVSFNLKIFRKETRKHYQFSDFSLGAYTRCYGAWDGGWGQMELTEDCGLISFTGFYDNYGSEWHFDNTIKGNVWTIRWSNTYGEYGYGEIYYPNGDWPITITD